MLELVHVNHQLIPSRKRLITHLKDKRQIAITPESIIERESPLPPLSADNYKLPHKCTASPPYESAYE